MSYMVNNILNGTADAGNAAGNTDRLATDKNTFLKLLVAQLTHQDPLNPTEDKEFVAQLAQFTSLEQLQAINSGVEGLNTTMTQSQLMTATGFIGKDIVTKGDQVTKFSDSDGNVYTTSIWYTIDDAAAVVRATVLDGNNNPVYFEEMGSHAAGTYSDFIWKGTDYNGNEVPEGVYKVVFSAEDSDGKAVLIKETQFMARVFGVLNEGGVYKLVLDGGRVVPLTDVTEISQMETSSGGNPGSGSGSEENAEG